MRYDFYYRETYTRGVGERSYTPPPVYTTAELLLRQTLGKLLTPHEKMRVYKYAEQARKQNKTKKRK